jgi:uncharacterized protein with PIN domain
MLGKLCRLLRIIGIDAAYSNEGMAILLSARKEGRTILTRNTRLRDKQDVFFIDSPKTALQLHAVVDNYNLWSEVKPFTRCVVCNETLIPVEKDAVKKMVPYFTYKHFEEYAQCPQCNRVYWKGSHYKNMLKEVEAMLGMTLSES